MPPEQKQLEARQKGEIPEDQMPQRQDESSDSEDENEGSKKRKKKGGDQNVQPLESFEVRKKKKERSMSIEFCIYFCCVLYYQMYFCCLVILSLINFHHFTFLY